MRKEALMKTMIPAPIQPFNVRIELDGGEAVLALTGELDLASADMLEREVRELSEVGLDGLVVDLRHVDFVDSTGLRTLISLRNTAKRRGCSLTLVPGPRRVQRIFDLTATRGLFDWRD
jgi:anti-sigma B factor antagonist